MLSFLLFIILSFLFSGVIVFVVLALVFRAEIIEYSKEDYDDEENIS